MGERMEAMKLRGQGEEQDRVTPSGKLWQKTTQSDRDWDESCNMVCDVNASTFPLRSSEEYTVPTCHVELGLLLGV